MDHLPLPPESRLIDVAITAAEEYDGGDFYSYPERKGWDVQRWRSRLTGPPAFDPTEGHALEDTLAFIQTWLCLGLLQSCLKRHFRIADFTKEVGGRKLWTNRNLESFLQEWKADLLSLRDDARRQVFDTTLDMINEACTVADVLDWNARRHPALQHTGLHQQIFLVSMLQDAVCCALRKICRPGIWHGITERSSDDGAMPYWLEYQLRLANWCPSTIRSLKLHFDHDAQAFAYGLGTCRADRDHSACSRLACFANALSSTRSASATKHRDPACDCSRISIDVSQVVEILSQGRVPGFVIETAPNRPQPLRLDVTPIDSGTVYFAISHVWADGLANPLANNLPACQLNYLREVVEIARTVDTAAHRIVIWFDGLCIPVETRHQALRDFSISQMRRIYENANGVLVLDPDLQRLDRETPGSELLMRLLLSGWASRLWTFQEGALNVDTLLVGRDHVFNLRDIRSGEPDWDQCLSSELGHSLTSRLRRQVVLPAMAFGKQPELSHTRLLAAVSSKSTSRPNDETVVLASYLRLNTTRLESTPDPAVRMIRLMQMLPFVPSNVVFAHGPRLRIEGSPADWGWVPRTLLAPYGVDDLIISDRPVPHDLENSDVLMPRPPSYIDSGPARGLATFFPGILVRPSCRDISFPITVQTQKGRFQVFDESMQRAREWAFRIPGLRVAIILSDFEPHTMRRGPGLLVYYLPSTPSDREDERSEGSMRTVFFGNVVAIYGENEMMYYGRPHLGDAASSHLDGTLINPTWWLLNSCSADFEAEKREWITSEAGPPADVTESDPWPSHACELRP